MEDVVQLLFRKKVFFELVPITATRDRTDKNCISCCTSTTRFLNKKLLLCVFVFVSLNQISLAVVVSITIAPTPLSPSGDYGSAGTLS